MKNETNNENKTKKTTPLKKKSPQKRRVAQKVTVERTERDDPNKSRMYSKLNEESFYSAVKTVAKYHFAKSQYYRSIGTMLLVFAILSVESYNFVTAKNFRPPDKYIPVYEDSTIIDPTPLNKPLMSDNENKQWLSEAVTEIFTYDYTSIDRHGLKIKQFFTDKGYENFWQQFTSTPDFLRVKNQSMNVVSQVIEPPVRLHDEEYKITGGYAYYEYKFKIRQVFISPTSGVIPVTYDMIATVIRQDQKKYRSGVAIHTIRVSSSSNLK